MFSAGLCYAQACGFVIEEPFAPDISYALSPVTSQGNDGAIQLTVSGGTGPLSFLWNTGGTSPEITGLEAGTYSVTVSYGDGVCHVPLEMSLVNCEELNAQIELLAEVYAVSGASSNDGAINLTVSGGEHYTFSFSWEGPNGFSANTQDIAGLQPGFYQVVVTHGMCPELQNDYLFELCGFGLTIIAGGGNPMSCDGFNLVAVPNSVNAGPYSYQWSNGATTQGIVAVYGMEHCVTVTGSSGCSVKRCRDLGPSPVFLTASAHLKEPATYGNSNGYAYAEAEGVFGPFDFVWSTGATGEWLEEVPPGIYMVTVTDECGYSAIAQVEVPCEFGTMDFQAEIVPVNCQQSHLGEIHVVPGPAGSTATCCASCRPLTHPPAMACPTGAFSSVRQVAPGLTISSGKTALPERLRTGLQQACTRSSSAIRKAVPNPIRSWSATPTASSPSSPTTAHRPCATRAAT